jgi:hypothetical protein
MKHIKYIFISLMALSLSANAEIFKCKNTKGEFIYQSEPCSSDEVPQGIVKVKQLTLGETEAAKAKLKAWQDQQALEEATKREAELERQADLERQESLALQRRSVIAQEQQAIAAQQRQYQGGGAYFPSYGFNGRNWNNQFFPPFGTLNPNMSPQQQPNIPWNQIPAGQAPFPMMPLPGQSPNPNGWGGGFHHR